MQNQELSKHGRSIRAWSWCDISSFSAIVSIACPWYWIKHYVTPYQVFFFFFFVCMVGDDLSKIWWGLDNWCRRNSRKKKKKNGQARAVKVGLKTKVELAGQWARAESVGHGARAELAVQGARAEPAKQVARVEAEQTELKTTGLGSAKSNKGFSHCGLSSF